MAAVADVLRKKVAAVPHAFGKCDFGDMCALCALCALCDMCDLSLSGVACAEQCVVSTFEPQVPLHLTHLASNLCNGIVGQQAAQTYTP
jgi:hypothetical protein